MPNLAVVDMTGKEVGTVELSEAIFGIEPNEPAMHRMVVNYLANNRQGTQSALTRSEVPAAEESLGSKRVQATQDRVRLVLHSGHTAVLFSHQSQEATDSRLIRR